MTRPGGRRRVQPDLRQAQMGKPNRTVGMGPAAEISREAIQAEPDLVNAGDSKFWRGSFAEKAGTGKDGGSR